MIKRRPEDERDALVSSRNIIFRTDINRIGYNISYIIHSKYKSKQALRVDGSKN